MVFQLPVVVGGKGEKGRLSLLLVNQKCLPLICPLMKQRSLSAIALEVSKNYLKN